MVREEPGKQKPRSAVFESRVRDCGRGNSPEAAPSKCAAEKEECTRHFIRMTAKRDATGGEKEAHSSCLATVTVIDSVTEVIR